MKKELLEYIKWIDEDRWQEMFGKILVEDEEDQD